jgi:hypothetical protein
MLAHFAELGFRTALEQRERLAVGVYSPNVPCDDPMSQHAVPRVGETAVQLVKSVHAAAVLSASGEPTPVAVTGAAVYDDVVALLNACSSPSIRIGAPAAAELDALMRNGERGASGPTVTWDSVENIKFPANWVPPHTQAVPSTPPVAARSPAALKAALAAAKEESESRLLGLTICVIERPVVHPPGTRAAIAAAAAPPVPPVYRRVSTLGVRALSGEIDEE